DLIDHVRSFRDEILQVLRRQEVSLIESKPGMFNEACQEAIDTRLVSHPEEDQQVVGIVRRGFSYRGRLLRPEEVVVGKFVESEEG
ncbi:MAG: nucleotide exchange factor GrpE, partial [Gammaproteobacteria bacterium]